ncbi:MAG: DUF2807 domain-containing protein [Myxococcota bacterium]|nr:DUF2807 domain-containing protein [Myxococcota bacterium]
MFHNFPRKRALLASLLVLSTLFGCVPKKLGNGVKETRTYEFGPIDQVEISGDWTVFAEGGVTDGAQRIMLKTDGNLLDLVELTVVGSRLVVAVKEPINPRSGLELHLRLAKLAAFSSAGAVKSQLNFSDLGGRLQTAGLSRVDAKVLDGELVIDARGASRVKLDGQAKSLSIQAESASRINAVDAQADQADIRASDASRVVVNVKRELSITAVGASNVSYDVRRHKPAVKATSTGSSQIMQIK